MHYSISVDNDLQTQLHLHGSTESPIITRAAFCSFGVRLTQFVSSDTNQDCLSIHLFSDGGTAEVCTLSIDAVQNLLAGRSEIAIRPLSQPEDFQA